ncbi:dihydropteroate synthase [Anaeroglobus geminatus F0357]|uniref:Dihydropteroate synthase n=1 Tax=Anaeroglobus geminatus F0357 TaxID=861450 RepID=G9YHA6_9FIRM|nr:dihydropteroate synthase [Anaeroglobus geminatus F0357]
MIEKPITYSWPDGKTLTLGKRTLIMGVLNVTADSFSDGGKWNTLDRALYHMEEMVRDGADIIDIGAESSRPGFVPVSAAAEMEVLSQFLPEIVKRCPVPVSVDTFKADTAEYAINEGAHIMNDIWGLQYEEEPGRMAAVAAKYDVPVIVMHNRNNTDYSDIIGEMKSFFLKSLNIADKAGIRKRNIILDPGIGFGKVFEQNVFVLQHLDELTALPHPMLLGVSRKRFIGQILDLPVTERMEGTGAACVAGILRGCNIMRIHDVKSVTRMCRMADALCGNLENSVQ